MVRFPASAGPGLVTRQAGSERVPPLSTKAKHWSNGGGRERSSTERRRGAQMGRSAALVRRTLSVLAQIQSP